MSEATARLLASTCRSLHHRGWVANHDGNVSCRLGDGRYLASPTAVSKGAVESDMLVVLDDEGKVVSGSRKGFSEFALHLAVYRARPDVAWVVHAHPPRATGWAVTGQSFFDPPFLKEPVVSLGARVPVVADGELGGAITEVDAVLLRNHGVVTVGADAETALLRMELVEHLAHIALVARQLGGAQPLPHHEIDAALAARAKAGLGPRPGAEAPVHTARAAGDAGRPDVASLVRDAMRRLG